MPLAKTAVEMKGRLFISTMYGHLDDTVLFVLKDSVCFLNLAERITVGDEWGGVNLAFG